MAIVSADGSFTQTRWSLVLQAGKEDSANSEMALGELYGRYRFPLYVYLRRAGHPHSDAEDLLQGFFERLIEKRWLAEADPHRGRFRSFLLKSLQHFTANDWRRAQAQCRGGGQEVFSLDNPEAAQRYEREPGSELAPDVLFDRRWAIEMLEHALASMRQEYDHAGEGERFAALEATLSSGRTEEGYAALATRLGLTVNGVKAAVHRLRRRFREFLCAEVADTVGSRVEVEAEMNHLLAILRETS